MQPLLKGGGEPYVGVVDPREIAGPDLLDGADDASHISREEVGDAGQDDRDVVTGRDHVADLVGHDVDADDGGDSGIAELTPHLGAGVQRIGVDHHTAGFQGPEGCDGVGQAVRHLDRDPIPLREAERLAQVHRECVGEPVHVAERQVPVHPIGHDHREGALVVVVPGGSDQLITQ